MLLAGVLPADDPPLSRVNPAGQKVDPKAMELTVKLLVRLCQGIYGRAASPF